MGALLLMSANPMGSFGARMSLEPGSAVIEPADPVVAGSYGTWRVTYTAGSRGVQPGGRIRIYTECDTDWGLPQLSDPAAAEYLTVDSPPGVPVAVRVDNVKSLTLFVRGRGLAPGERVTTTYGDRSGGGPGSRAQCFAEQRRYFHVDVVPDSGARAATLPASPYLSIVGGDAAKLIVIAPSTVSVGDTIRLLVRAEDPWGNPASGYRHTVTLSADAIALADQAHAFSSNDGGLWWTTGHVTGPGGLYTITARDSASSLAAESNPIRCTTEKPTYALHWGDPHGGQVANAEKIPDFFRYARDAAALSFVGYQRNDHAHSNADYAAQQAAEREVDAPGRLVPLPGFEWSGEPDHGGHHNVYFRRHGQPMRRNSHWGLDDLSDADDDLPHVRDLHNAYRGTDTLITPHVGGGHADLTYHEPTLEPALEITSTHGSFEWFLRESLEHGYRMGFVGGSDSHDGRPGADSPGFQERRYAKGGLTGLYVRDLTLGGVHEALKARRCYATTGARIIAEVGAGGHLMGEELSTDVPPAISVKVAGTAALEAVELYRGLHVVYDLSLNRRTLLDAVRVLWQGASRKMSYAGVAWDGRLRVSGATIADVGRIRFDSPRSYVADVTADVLRWHSVQCGYRSGLVLRLTEATQDAALHVALETTAHT